MANFFATAFEKLEKIPASLLFTITFALGAIVFAPQDIAEKLSIDAFRDEYRSYLGPSLILLIAFLLARFITSISNFFRRKKIAKHRLSQLKKLTPEEKGYLAQFILNGRNTIKVGLEDGIMGGLVAKKICYRSSNMIDLIDGTSFNLQPWAREHLENNHHLLEGGNGQPLTPRERLHERYF